MKPQFFYLHEHTYPGLNYKTILQTKKDWHNVLHTHDYYELLLVTAGSVEHFINGETIEIHKGELFLIRPRDVHKLTITKDGSEYMNMNFSRDIMSALMQFWGRDALEKEIENSNLPPVRTLEDTDLEYVRKRMFQTMFRENVSFPQQEYIMKKKLFDIFTTFFARNVCEEKKKGPKWLSETVKEMEKKENFSVGLSRMVEISGKSIEHLSRSLVKFYGYSPTKYINMLRVDYMASMLEYSDWPIIDIWLDAGFESAGYAYKLFKEKYGVTPQQHRKNSMML